MLISIRVAGAGCACVLAVAPFALAKGILLATRLTFISMKLLMVEKSRRFRESPQCHWCQSSVTSGAKRPTALFNGDRPGQLAT